MAEAIVKRRVIIGWRHEAINHVLDICAGTIGYVIADHVLLHDSRGRLQKKWSSKSEKCRGLKILNREKYFAAKAREKQKLIDDYEEYTSLYLRTFPGGTPCTYRTFAKLGIAPRWRADPMNCVLFTYAQYQAKEQHAAYRRA